MDLYHVTPNTTRDSITRQGVEPIYSRGKMRVSWWVDRSRLMWALAHVSAKHQVSVDKLDIWVTTDKQIKNRHRSAWQGVFYTPCRTIPSHHYSATREIETPDANRITKRL